MAAFVKSTRDVTTPKQQVSVPSPSSTARLVDDIVGMGAEHRGAHRGSSSPQFSEGHPYRSSQEDGDVGRVECVADICCTMASEVSGRSIDSEDGPRTRLPAR